MALLSRSCSELGVDGKYLPDPRTLEKPDSGLGWESDPVMHTEASDRAEWLHSVQVNIEAEANTTKLTGPFYAELFSREHGPKICKLDTDVIRAVTIGPYHRSCRHDQVIFNDDYKWAVTRHIAKQWTHFNSAIYLEAMEKMEEKARDYYEDDFPMEFSRRDFLVMLLLDSAFILFVLDALGDKELLPSGVDRFDYVPLLSAVNENAMRIKVDLLTLDNQIPFFAVEQLYVISHGDKADYDLQEKFRDLVLSGFDDLYPKRKERGRINFKYTEFDHLLHLFHWSRIPKGKYGSGSRMLRREKDVVLHIPRATELQKCAINFRRKTSGSFLDITFQDSWTKICGEMSIPAVHVDDYSRDLFRNLIAFEMNFIENGCCVMAYCKCMSHVLQHDDDVKLLRDGGIVESTIYKDADVIKFFDNFNEVVGNQRMPVDLYDLYAKVRKHHKRGISNYYGRMKLQYFPNIWVRLSIVAGIVLFLFTLLQTTYAMLSYYETFR